MDAKAPELTGLALRSLQLSDYHRGIGWQPAHACYIFPSATARCQRLPRAAGFLELLGQLTDVGDVSFEQFQRKAGTL